MFIAWRLFLVMHWSSQAVSIAAIFAAWVSMFQSPKGGGQMVETIRVNRNELETQLVKESIVLGNKVKLRGKLWIIVHIDDQDIILDEVRQYYGI